MLFRSIQNFRDHGVAARTIEHDLPAARADLDALEKLGISYDQVTQQLQDEGVQKFADSFRQLFAGIESKQKVIKEKQTA